MKQTLYWLSAGLLAAGLAQAQPSRLAGLQRADAATGARRVQPAATATPAQDPEPTTPLAVGEGFGLVDALNDGIYYDGWIRQNNSDQPYKTWYRGAPNVFPAYDGVGSNYLAQNWYATLSDTGTISSWALSPSVNFGPATRLSFLTRTVANPQNADRLQVRACNHGSCTNVGTRPEDVGDFDVLLLDINADELDGAYPADWTRYVLATADGLPASGNGRIAFRYYLHQNDGVLRGDYIGIDRVTIDADPGANGGLDLAVTLAPVDPVDPNACGTATSLAAVAGDKLNVCYKVTNHSGRALNEHWLRDDRGHYPLAQHAQALAPDASYQFNRVVTIGESQSPSWTWTAQPDPPAYTHDAFADSNFVDISGDGTELVINPNGMTDAVALPADFDFRYYGARIDSFCVLVQGLIEIPRRGCLADNNMYHGARQPIPSIDMIDIPTLAVYWSRIGDRAFDQNGRLFTKLVGTAPNRQFIVQWDRIRSNFGGDGYLTAEAVLNEGSHVIEYRYDHVTFGSSNPAEEYGGDVSIGVQSDWIGIQYAYVTGWDPPVLEHVRRIVWTPADPAAYTATQQVQIQMQVPQLELGDASVDVAVASHGAATRTLDVANRGDGRLDWHAATAAASANHMPAVARKVTPLGDASPAALQRVLKAPHLQRAAAAAPTATAALGDTNPLWAFDVIGGYVVRGNTAHPGIGGAPYGDIAANAAGTISGADFLDDDFHTLYGFDNDSHEVRRWQFDPSRQAFAPAAAGDGWPVADLPPNVIVSGFKQDPTSGVVYIAGADGATTKLWTIDPETAAVRPVGSTTEAPGVIAIAFDMQGRLYGVDVLLDALVAINKKDGSAAQIGSLGIDAAYLSGLAFDPADGQLYFATIIDGVSSMWTIDAQSGAASMIAPINSPEWLMQFGSMTFSRQTSACTRPVDVPWLTVTPADGSIDAGAAGQALTLGFDAAAMADGVYSANLCLYSNDPMQRRTSLPVRFTVGTPDRLFANGFDPPVR